MKYIIELQDQIVAKTFEKALNMDYNSRSNFLHDLRKVFKQEIESFILSCGIHVYKNRILSSTANLLSGKTIEDKPIQNKYKEELDAKVCANYGHDDYSLGAINYTENEFCSLPSLFPFVKVKEFSIGNIAVLVENSNYDIEVRMPSSIKIAGYSYDISSKKRKSYLCFLGVRFNHDFLKSFINKYYNGCKCEDNSLDEIRLGLVHFPITFICRRCGKLYTCECFAKYFKIDTDFSSAYRSGRKYEEDLQKKIQNIGIRKGICHLCTGDVPKQIYGSNMYFSGFLQRYRPYYELLSRKRYGRTIFTVEDESKEIENEVRKQFGYPQIGEKWISETILYKVVKSLFPSKEVIFHYKGKELEGLELDIWIPEIKLGIEYQGEQHYKAIEVWDGEEGLKKRIESDTKKRELCKKLNYKLIEFKFDEDLSVDKVERKLSKYFL